MTWVTFEDMRAAKFCARGTRGMFNRYGIDLEKVLRERGISAAELKEKTGEHSMVDRVIKLAQERESGKK